MTGRLLLLLLPLALSACVSVRPAVESRGERPALPATFRLSGAPPGEGDVPAVERQVAEALKERGFEEVAPEAPPRYLVDVALSERPRGVAAAVPSEHGEARTVAAAPRRSLRQPLTRGAATLTLRIVERISGREIYAATATRLYRKSATAEDLVRAAVQPLGGPPS